MRNFLMLMYTGISCFQSIPAMELVRCQNQQDEVLVDIPHRPWSREYSRNIKEVPDVANLKKLRELLENKRHLPEIISPLQHLLYLSTIRKGSDKSKTLFTQKQQNKFDKAESIKRWVPRCFCINGTIIAFTSPFPFTSAVSFLECANSTFADCLSSASTVLTPATISMIGSLAVGFSSLYATGLSPDLSSRKANTVQDEIGSLRRQYLTLAKHLIDIHFDSENKAKQITDMFDIEELKERAEIKTCKSEAHSGLISPLEEACNYIKKGELLDALTETELYIWNKLNSKQNEANNKRIALLENALLKQKTKRNKKKHGKK